MGGVLGGGVLDEYERGGNTRDVRMKSGKVDLMGNRILRMKIGSKRERR